MNNVLFESLPTEWNGYEVNTGFHIGVQLSILMEDETLNERLRTEYIIGLLFGNEDGTMRDYPDNMEDLSECLKWFMGGWHHDNTTGDDDDERIIDFDIDQGRIFADFMHLYHIDLEFTEMHWWKFNWLLWNMPREQSSFMQVIEIRTKKPSKNASSEEKQAIRKGKAIYGLKKKPKQYSANDIKAIDEFDSFMASINRKKEKE